MSQVSSLRRFTLGLLAAVASAAALALPAAASTLATVKQRGVLHCGVSEGLNGFSAKDAQGAWSGFDVDFCRALAAAVLGDPQKVSFTPLSASERFDALKAAKVDLLSRNSTWTLGREAELGLAFAGITYQRSGRSASTGRWRSTRRRSASRRARPRRPTSPTSSGRIR